MDVGAAVISHLTSPVVSFSPKYITLCYKGYEIRLPDVVVT